MIYLFGSKDECGLSLIILCFGDVDEYRVRFSVMMKDRLGKCPSCWPSSCPILPPLINDESTGDDETAEPSTNPDEPGSLDTAMVIMAEGLTTLRPLIKVHFLQIRKSGMTSNGHQ